jgi:hypothetical protein
VTSARRTGARVALAAAVALALIAPVVGLVPAAPVVAATTDLTLITDASYDVRPASGLVHVTVAISAKNHTSETKAQKFYFDSGYLALPPGVSNLKISGYAGATVGVSKRTSSTTLVRIGFGGHLYSGLSRTFSLGFDLKDPGGDAGRQTRISASLAVFPVWAFASTGATGSTVTVTFPVGYTVTIESGSFEHKGTAADGGTRLSTEPIAKPLSFFAYVLGERPPDVVDTPLALTAGGASLSLTLRAWVDDPGWTKRIQAELTAALPALAGQIGLPWPTSAPTVFAESVNRTTGGNAGVFDPTTGRIEIAYWAGPLVAIHEAAHGWFSGSLVSDRWAAEGFAALYAQRVATGLKLADTSPVLTDALEASRVPLNHWSASSAAPDRGTDGYGFAASLAVARLIADDAGDAAMRAVWADAAAHVGAYQPPAASAFGVPAGTQKPELVSTATDWRGLLDLIEARSGKDLSGVWRTWVVDDAQASLLDERVVARIAYARTLALVNGWALPRSVRDALRAWQFDKAEALLSDARTVLAQRATVEARAARIGLQLPDAVQRFFEAGAFDAASIEAQAENDTMLAIRSAVGGRPQEPDLLTRIGLIGADPDGDLATARTALAAGSLDAALAAAASARETWDGAWQTGRQRVMLAIAAVAGLAVVASWLAGRRRGTRRQARPASRPRGARPA